IGILPAARFLSLHRIFESDFSANGLRLSEVWRSCDGTACTGWQIVRDKLLDHYLPCAVGGRFDAANRVISYCDYRQRDLRSERVCHDTADRVVRGCRQQSDRWCARTWLPPANRQHSSVLSNVGDLPDDFLDWRGVLFAARL